MKPHLLHLAAVCLAILTPNPMNAAPTTTPTTQFATFGGGCFWCIEAVFERLEGVKKVVSGYAGGTVDNPSYEQVCTGKTGHAEVVQVEFDPAKITYERILQIFFNAHDPTTLNRQGADKGTQYRSVVFYQSDEQRIAAEKAVKEGASRFSSPIVTEITPLKKFYAAEDYHQHYFAKHPENGYCSVVIAPKVKKLQEKGVIP